MFKIGPMGDFYGGPVVKNLPSKTEDACLIPGQGTKIPHTAGQRSLHATSREAHVLQLEKTAHLMKSPHCSEDDPAQLNKTGHMVRLKKYCEMLSGGKLVRAKRTHPWKFWVSQKLRMRGKSSVIRTGITKTRLPTWPPPF